MIEDITAAAHRVMVERDARVEMLRVGPQLAYDLEAEMWRRTLEPHTFRPPTPYEPGPLGLTVVVDRHLPPDVWRLCDADGTLLYDCREGKTLA